MQTTTLSEVKRRRSGPVRYGTSAGDVDNLLVELDRYRRESEWLQRINDLHGRLAGALDLSSVVETFSVWLMPMVSHDLMAYRNLPRNRFHIIASTHGPGRQELMPTAKAFVEGTPEQPPQTDAAAPGTGSTWPLGDSPREGELLLLRSSGRLDPDENRLIGEAGKILNEALHRALNYEDLFEQARIDALTGLSNRRVFEERIHVLVETSRRHNRPLTLASMDLDHFKLVNDTFGHAEGDSVLRKVAETLKSRIRATDLLVRMGGDEFMLLLPDTKLRAGRNLTNRLIKAVQELDVLTPGRNKLGISIGLAQWQANMSTEDWVKRADEGLYKAKTSGRSKVCTVQTSR